MNSKIRSSTKNTVAALIMQAVVMVIGIILPRLYIKEYGSEVNGLVTSITQFISYFTIIEAGLASAGTNALFKPIALKDVHQINRIVAAIKKFYFQVGYIFSALIVGLALIYPVFVSVEGWTYWDIVALVIVLGMYGIIDFFTLSKHRALLTADQRYYVVANATTIAYIINFIAVYLAIKLSFGITVVRAIALTLYIVRSLIINVYVRVKYKYVDSKVVPDYSALEKRWDAMILQLLGLAQTALPAILLTVFCDDLAIVSVYSIYNLVASSIIALLGVVTNGVAGTLGNIIARKKDELKSFYMSYEVLFLSVSSCVYACMMVMYLPFIKLYTSGITDYEYVYPLTALLFTLNGLFYNFKTPAGTLIGTAGVFKETKKGTIIQTIIAVVLCVALTPILGINGLLIGLIASNLYRTVELVIFMSRNVTHIPPWRSFKQIIVSFIAFIVSCVPFMFIKLEPENYLLWFMQAVLVFLCSVIITVIMNLICNMSLTITLSSKLKKIFLKGKQK